MNVMEVDDEKLSFLPIPPQTKEGVEVIRCMLFISYEIIAFFIILTLTSLNFVLLIKLLEDAYYL